MYVDLYVTPRPSLAAGAHITAENAILDKKFY